MSESKRWTRSTAPGTRIFDGHDSVALFDDRHPDFERNITMAIAAPQMLEALRAAARSFQLAHACRHIPGGGGRGPKSERLDAWCECDAVAAAIRAATGGE